MCCGGGEEKMLACRSTPSEKKFIKREKKQDEGVLCHVCTVFGFALDLGGKQHPSHWRRKFCPWPDFIRESLWNQSSRRGTSLQPNLHGKCEREHMYTPWYRTPTINLDPLIDQLNLPWPAFPLPSWKDHAGRGGRGFMRSAEMENYAEIMRKMRKMPEICGNYAFIFSGKKKRRKVLALRGNE